jgi:LmbE family N-acetylglucosaminyl deacetylase
MLLSGRMADSRIQSLCPADAGERLLIVAPHMDDEAISAAGYAADAIARGASVSIVFLTAGDANRFCAQWMFRTLDPTPANFLTVGNTRIAESATAARRLGVAPENVFILGYPDAGLEEMLMNPEERVRSIATGCSAVAYAQALSPGAPHQLANLLADLAEVFDRVRPTLVIAPVTFDAHPDHSAAAAIVDLALTRARLAPRRLSYLVHRGRYMTSVIWHRQRDVVPPRWIETSSWTSYALSERARAIKHEVLESYDSQRPYLTLLRNGFVRPNELFYAHSYEPQVVSSWVLATG